MVGFSWLKDGDLKVGIVVEKHCAILRIRRYFSIMHLPVGARVHYLRTFHEVPCFDAEHILKPFDIL